MQQYGENYLCVMPVILPADADKSPCYMTF